MEIQIKNKNTCMYDYLTVKMINGKDTIYAELNYDEL